MWRERAERRGKEEVESGVGDLMIGELEWRGEKGRGKWEGWVG